VPELRWAACLGAEAAKPVKKKAAKKKAVKTRAGFSVERTDSRPA
jgi:hypothetical protein